jgi:hypothetical protein
VQKIYYLWHFIEIQAFQLALSFQDTL